MYLQPAERDIWACVGWWPLKLQVYVISSPSTMVAGLMLRVAASHRFAAHVAAVRVPAVQELVPETVYPESHVGWHVDPLARELVQLPTAPFVGAVDASQD